MEGEIVNKVAQSGLLTIDVDKFYPQGERILFDIAPYLWNGIALRESDFREFVKTHDWTRYRNTFVAITCSADAIVPVWAYMLIASALDGISKTTIFGSLSMLESTLFKDQIAALDTAHYKDKRVILSGCGKVPIPESAYVDLVNKLQPVAKSIMFGEACSTVPVYKQKK